MLASLETKAGVCFVCCCLFVGVCAISLSVFKMLFRKIIKTYRGDLNSELNAEWNELNAAIWV